MLNTTNTIRFVPNNVQFLQISVHYEIENRNIGLISIHSNKNKLQYHDKITYVKAISWLPIGLFGQKYTKFDKVLKI